LFIILFIFMLEVRFLNPSISYAEKFMDHAFLASIINNPVIPPVDPWYSGGDLNMYYYMGHWMMGALGFIAGIKSTIVFNLVLPTVFANTGIALYASGKLLLKRYQWLPVAILFLVNPAFIWYAINQMGLNSVMWDSTRTIENAITEYPLFSMLWGDPHAHVISFFNQALLIFILIYAYLKWNETNGKGRNILLLAGALSLGTMPLINTWDVLLYAPLTLIFAGLTWHRSYKRDHDSSGAWRLFFLMPAIAILFYLPYYFMLNSAGIEGIGFVHTPTGPIPFLLVYGIFLLIFYAECLKDLRKRPYLLLILVPFILTGFTGAGLVLLPAVCLLLRRTLLPEEVLSAAGLMIIMLTEIIYLIDNMGDIYYRMNTVFKFSLVAWFLMGTGGAVFVGKWLSGRADRRENNEQADPEKEKKRKIALLVIILIALSIPVVLPDLNYGYGGKTLDGMAWLENFHPYDYDAISYIRENSLDFDSAVILEATGGDYTYYSRVSSMTGIPAVIGEPFHEQMWRGYDSDVGYRKQEVEMIYESPEDFERLTEKYNVTHIYVGDTEIETYNIDLPVEKLDIYYQNENVTIYSIEGSGN
jgi:YYY domain-containing protein